MAVGYLVGQISRMSGHNGAMAKPNPVFSTPAQVAGLCKFMIGGRWIFGSVPDDEYMALSDSLTRYWIICILDSGKLNQYFLQDCW
jgi:hypothetical protein